MGISPSWSTLVGRFKNVLFHSEPKAKNLTSVQGKLREGSRKPSLPLRVTMNCTTLKGRTTKIWGGPDEIGATTKFLWGWGLPSTTSLFCHCERSTAILLPPPEIATSPQFIGAPHNDRKRWCLMNQATTKMWGLLESLTMQS